MSAVVEVPKPVPATRQPLEVSVLPVPPRTSIRAQVIAGIVVGSVVLVGNGVIVCSMLFGWFR